MTTHEIRKRNRLFRALQMAEHVTSWKREAFSATKAQVEGGFDIGLGTGLLGCTECGCLVPDEDGRGVVRGAEERVWPHPSIWGCCPGFCPQRVLMSHCQNLFSGNPVGRSEALVLASIKFRQYLR